MVSFDEHGSIDLLNEVWLDLAFEKGLEYSSIEGATVNTVLKGQFLLHGLCRPDHVLPGGTSAWREAAPAVFTSLFHIATVSQVMTRVRVVLSWHYQLHHGDSKGGQSQSLSRKSRAELNALASGALIFLRLMVVEFVIHVCMKDLLELYDCVDNLTDFCVPVKEVRDLHSELLLKLTEATAMGQGVLGDFGSKHACNEALMPRLETTSHRAHSTFAMGRPSGSPLAGGSSIAQGSGALGAGALGGGSQAVDNYMRESVDVFGVAAARKQTNGVWDGDSSDSDADWDRIAPSDDGREGSGASAPVAGGKAPTAVDKRPDVRMDQDQCFAERVVPFIASSLGEVPVTLWSFDVVETARQWTLMDHRLYCKIVLYELIAADGDGTLQCNWEVPRYIAGATGVRDFVDRFDAEALWVSYSVLSGHDGDNTPAGRARVVRNTITLAGALCELNNFSGMMAILTGLQQTSIRRLNDTWALVPPDSMQTLESLKNIMSTSNNFREYREEFARRFGSFGDQTGAERYFAHFSSEMGERRASVTGLAPFGGAGGDDEGASAIVPHLGAHLTEILGIVEGNGQYLEGNPHLLNFNRLMHISNSLGMLGRAQQLQYHLRYLRQLTSVINLGVSKFVCLSDESATTMKDTIWDMSQAAELSRSPDGSPNRMQGSLGSPSVSFGAGSGSSPEPVARNPGFLTRMMSSR